MFGLSTASHKIFAESRGEKRRGAQAASGDGTAFCLHPEHLSLCTIPIENLYFNFIFTMYCTARIPML